VTPDNDMSLAVTDAKHHRVGRSEELLDEAGRLILEVERVQLKIGVNARRTPPESTHTGALVECSSKKVPFDQVNVHCAGTHGSSEDVVKNLGGNSGEWGECVRGL